MAVHQLKNLQLYKKNEIYLPDPQIKKTMPENMLNAAQIIKIIFHSPLEP